MTLISGLVMLFAFVSLTAKATVYVECKKNRYSPLLIELVEKDNPSRIDLQISQKAQLLFGRRATKGLSHYQIGTVLLKPEQPKDVFSLAKSGDVHIPALVAPDRDGGSL